MLVETKPLGRLTNVQQTVRTKPYVSKGSKSANTQYESAKQITNNDQSTVTVNQVIASTNDKYGYQATNANLFLRSVVNLNQDIKLKTHTN